MDDYAPYAKLSTDELGETIGQRLKPLQRAELKKRAQAGDKKAEELLTGARARENEVKRRRKAKKKQQDEEDYEDEDEASPETGEGDEEHDDSDVPLAQVMHQQVIRKKGIARPVKRNKTPKRAAPRAQHNPMQPDVVYSTDDDAIDVNRTSRTGRRRLRQTFSDNEDSSMTSEVLQLAAGTSRDVDRSSVADDMPSEPSQTAKVPFDIDRPREPAAEPAARVEDQVMDDALETVASRERFERSARMEALEEEGDRLMKEWDRLQQHRPRRK